MTGLDIHDLRLAIDDSNNSLSVMIMVLCFWGGDFNCMETPLLDKNHPEPHPAYSSRITQIVKTHLMCGGFLTAIIDSTPGAIRKPTFYL